MTVIKDMSTRGKIWAVGLVCLVLVQTFASLLLPHSFALVAISDLVQLVLLLLATGSCVAAAFRSRRRARLFWTLMAIGVASWLAYQSLWTYFEVLRRVDVPSLFAGDAILFLHIVPMMAALALQPNAKQGDRNLRLGSLDFALLLLWWLYLYVYSVMPWQYVYANESAYNANLNASYLAEKLAFLAGIAFLWFHSSHPWKRIYLHWFGASLLYSLSSYVANWALNRNLYYSGSLYDLPLVVSMAWAAIPALLALKNPPEQEKAESSVPGGVWAARLGMLAVFSLPIFAWTALFDTTMPSRVRTFRLMLTLGAMVVMGALVFLKQHLLDIELIHLLRTSREAFDESQRLQTQLIQSEKLASLGQLVGGAAHELNNPLTALLGYSELLGNTELKPEQRALSDKISQQAKRMRGLVSSLLSFAKQGPSSKTSLDVNSIIKTAVKLCQPQMQAARVQSSLNLTDPLPLVLGDSNQLLQVFSHIINNAANAMSGGGMLKVSSAVEGRGVLIQFSDSGPGMLEPDRVFDPFYTTRPVGQGTGLGLSACYGIIQDHGGKIACRNEPAGGAVFLVELPATGQAKSILDRIEEHALK